jgi:hypothetical protein
LPAICVESILAENARRDLVSFYREPSQRDNMLLRAPPEWRCFVAETRFAQDQCRSKTTNASHKPSVREVKHFTM